MIAAIDTDGRIYCALTQANTNSDVMIMFLQKLTKQLDQEDSTWKMNSTIFLDNVAWNSNPDIK